MKRCIDTITSVLCVSNIVVLIVLKMKVTKLEKRYTDRANELVDAVRKRYNIVSEWFQNDKISSNMFREYCDLIDEKDD